MKRIVFIADYFAKHITGGGELNNEELINNFRKKGYDIDEIQSRFVTPDLLKTWEKAPIILSNFIELSLSSREALSQMKYIIYEHDHKYLKSRNPATYEEYRAPLSEILNYALYKNAIAVLCQSKFHKDIVEKNLNISNIISLGGNLWSDNSLDIIEEICKTEKKDCCSILESNIPHKNTSGCIAYCDYKNIKYELISDGNYANFLKKLGANSKFIFLPKTPETLSRVVVEARMMGCSVLCNNMVGATSEEWFQLKGIELIDHMRNKKREILSIIENLFENVSFEIEKRPIISLITTFHDGTKQNLKTKLLQIAKMIKISYLSTQRIRSLARI